MKYRKIQCLILCLALCLTLLPTAAMAEGAESIVGFEALGDAALIRSGFKPALAELEKSFPAAVTVTLASGKAESDPVTWRCLEDYDEELEEFHFVPVLDRPVKEGVPLPEIRVLIEGKPAHPVMEAVERPEMELPVVGILAPDGSRRTAASLPSSYNAYERGLLPPIRDQGEYGTCWAHASIGCMEADLIHDGAAGTGIDLSELHLVYFGNHSYADAKGCNTGDTVTISVSDYINLGGYSALSVNRLANLVGPAQEATVPYSWISNYYPSASAGRRDGCSIQLSGAQYLSIDDHDAIKYSILSHGGVDAAYCAMDDCYSATYNSYYNPTAYSANHEIMLVGWNDSFSRNNFRGSSKPSGNGAWLVRNSWGGSGYGYEGYFWISYYDKSLGAIVTAMDAVPDQYDHCYAYDGSPIVSWYSMDESEVVTTQQYRITGGETICALGIETVTASLNVSISLSCGGKTVTQRCSTSYPGYYLVPLNKTIPVTKDSTATLKITYTGSGGMNIPVEGSGSGSIAYNANCGSGGMVIVGGRYNFNTDSDSVVRLFTNDGVGGYVYGKPDFTLPAATKTIEKNAFGGLAMHIVYVPDKCSSIGAQAFAKCLNLTQIRLPKNCSISSTAFSGCRTPILVFAPAGGTTETWCKNRSDVIFVAE